MKTQTTLLDDGRARLEIEVPVDVLEHDMEHTLHDLAERVKIPGFRKGKVPRNVVLQRLGREEVLSETLRDHLVRWTDVAARSAGLVSYDSPDVDYESLPDEGEPFRYTAVVLLRPKGVLPEELALEVPRADMDVPDEEVDEEIARLRLEASPLVSVERPAIRGDVVELRLAASVAGKRLDGMHSDGLLAELGVGHLMPEVEQAVVGARAGASEHVTLTLPDDYPNPKLRGKDADVAIDLLDVRERALVELDDAFARAISEHDTFAALRADIRRSFQERIDDYVTGTYRRNVLIALAKQVQVKLPPRLVVERAESDLYLLAERLERQGIPFGSFLQRSGRSIDEVRNELRREAVAAILQEIAIEAFADRQGITLPDDELRELLLAEAHDEEDPAAAVEEVMASDAKERLREELRLRLALDQAVELATPISIEQAEAREKLWTPDKDEQEGERPAIWTPGS